MTFDPTFTVESVRLFISQKALKSEISSVNLLDGI